MTDVLDQPTKSVYTLVEFEYGDPLKFARYTDANEDISTVVGFFTSNQSIKVTTPARTVGVKEQTLKIDLPLLSGDQFADSISGGRLHAPTEIKIMELVRGEPPMPDVINTLFTSQLHSTTRNPNGRNGLVRVVAYGPKELTNVKLGLQCNPQCSWTFGSENGCKIVLSHIHEFGTCSLGTDYFVTITGLAPAARQDYWRAGFIEYDGLKLKIREWDRATPTRFQLSRLPPADWNGATVRVVPGCLRTPGACRDWGNEARFLGLGLGMPAYNPVAEVER